MDSPLETGAGSWENEGLAEKNSFFTCPLLKSGLQGLLVIIGHHFTCFKGTSSQEGI